MRLLLHIPFGLLLVCAVGALVFAIFLGFVIFRNILLINFNLIKNGLEHSK